MKLVTAILGAAHGLRGEVRADIRTDNPKQRFVKGVVIETDNSAYPTLTVRGIRKNNDKTLISFEEVTDRNEAEKLKFTKLFVDSDELQDEDDQDAFYPHQLQGLKAIDTDQNLLGEVVDLVYGKAHDLLIVETENKEKVMVPFVYEIVPEINIEQGYVLLDPPNGLF